MTPDQQTIQHIIDTHFGPLIAPSDCAAQGSSPGILVGVIVGGQRYYFQCGHVPMAVSTGAAPATQDIVVLIGSNTKVVTATLLALAQGHDAPTSIPIALDTAAAALLPDGIAIGSYPHDPIRLWHLASHSAGFPDGPCGQRRFGDYTFEQTSVFLHKFVPPYPPGQFWFYSDQGFALLGALLSHAYTGSTAAVTGAHGDWDASYRNWPAIAAKHITQPLGMSSTQVDYSSVADRVAQGYGFDGAGQPYPTMATPILVEHSAALGAGALSSTLSDMLDFLQAQIAPADDALGAAIRLTQHAQNTALATGLGWQIGNGFFYKNGLVPGYASYMAVDPANAVGLFAFANSWGDDKGASLCAAGRNALGVLRSESASPGHPAAPTSTIPSCPT